MNAVESEKCFLVICETLRLVVKRCTADEKYSLLKRVNLTQPIQMQLSQKERIFTEFFSAIFKFILNFDHFQEKDDTHS